MDGEVGFSRFLFGFIHEAALLGEEGAAEAVSAVHGTFTRAA